MRIATMVKVAVVLTALWLFLLGPGMWNNYRISRAAAGYAERVMLITKASCIGGQTRRDKQGRTTTDPRTCFVEGTVDGAPATLEVGGTIPDSYAEGTSLPIWWNPAMPESGINHQSLRVVPRDEAPAEAGRSITAALKLPLISLTFVFLLGFAYRLTAQRAEPDPTAATWTIGRDPGVQPLGLLVAAGGLSLVAAQFPNVAVGGLVLGLLATAIGAALLLRPFVTLERGQRRLLRGVHLFGLRLGGRSLTIPANARVKVREDAMPVRVEVDAADTTVRLAELRDVAEARSLAAAAGSFIGGEVVVAKEEVEEKDEDEEEDEGEEYKAPQVPAAVLWARRWFFRVLVIGLCAGMGFVAAMPQYRERVAIALLDPSSGAPEATRAPAVRAFAARRLAASPSDAAIRALVRCLNTVDPAKEPELSRTVTAELSGLAAQPPAEQEGWFEATARLNTWAAQRLDRTLDANGGTLGWFEVDPRLRASIDAIAGENLREAWTAWDLFGAGDIRDPEQFLVRAGAALGDSRPLHFAIVRGAFFYGTRAFEGQPEPIEAYRDRVIVTTVGEALALKLWGYRGVGDDSFPEDFRAWWASYARARRLPTVAAAERE